MLIKDIINRIGRRGLFLAFLSVLDGVFGSFLLTVNSASISEPYPIMPKMAWAIMWLIACIVTASGIFIKHDRISYGFAAFVKCAWGVRYLYLWYLGFPYAWISAVVWLCFSLTVLVISSWPEEIVVLPPEGRKN